MERNIFTKKKDKITFIPIKHFSPTSAKQVENFLNSSNYDTLCLEMPIDVQKIVEQIASDSVVLPCSILLIDKQFAYMPLFSFSPEVVAIKHALDRGKKIVCIDVPYSDKDTVLEDNETYFLNNSTYFSAYTEMNLQSNFSLYYKDILKLAEMCSHSVTTRENFMASKIVASAEGNTVVVLGANHLINVEKSLNDTLPINTSETAEVHLVPYVPTDFKIEYGYYKKLFYLAESEDPFADAVLELLLEAAERTVNEYKLHISITDVINAVSHAKLLSQFRGLPNTNLSAVMESVKTCIEKNGNGEFELVLNKIINEIPRGRVKTVSTPLLKNFVQLLREFRLYDLEKGKQVILKIIENPGHREKSKFLHSLSYLEIPFAVKVSGANYLTGENKNLTREIWEILDISKTYEEIIKLSHIGKSVSNVAQIMAENELINNSNYDLKDIVSLYLKMYFMGLKGDETLSKIDDLISNQTSFSDTVFSLARMNYLLNIKEIFSGAKSLGDFRVSVSLCDKAVGLLRQAGRIGEKAEDDARSFSALSGLVLKFNNSSFEEIVNDVKHNTSLSPIFFGSILSYVCKKNDSELELVKNYLATVDSFDAGMFLTGVIIGYRGMFLKDGGIFDIIMDFIENLSNENFLECLPHLRYAFTRLTPEQAKRTANYISRQYNFLENDLGSSTMFDISLLKRDKEVEIQLKTYGFID